MDRDGYRITSVSARGLVVTFDTGIYRLDAIKKAAYRFGDRCHIHIDPVDDRHVQVLLKAKQPTDEGEYLAGDFCNEALDQELRCVVAQETEGIRNLLLAEAFSKTSLIQREADTADYHDDRANISRPDRCNP